MHNSESLFRFVRSFFCIGIGVCTLVASLLTVQQAVDPALKPRNFSAVSGSLSSGSVLLDTVKICGCWNGLHGQMEKKVKFRITNNSQFPLNLAGGKTSSVYLVIGYPDAFAPSIEMPQHTTRSWPFKSQQERDQPPGVDLVATRDSETVIPVKFADPVWRTQLGLPEGWTAWGIPANPSRLVGNSDGRGSNATYVTRDRLPPAESYYDPDDGVGVWVFNTPLPEHLRPLTEREEEPTESPSYFDSDFMILGVGAIRDNGQLLGFSPLPPETEWTDSFH